MAAGELVVLGQGGGQGVYLMVVSDEDPGRAVTCGGDGLGDGGRGPVEVVGGVAGGDQGGGLGLASLDVGARAGVGAVLGQVQGAAGYGDGQCVPQVVAAVPAERQGRDAVEVSATAADGADVDGYDGVAQGVGDDGVGGFVSGSGLVVEVVVGVLGLPGRAQLVGELVRVLPVLQLGVDPSSESHCLRHG